MASARYVFAVCTRGGTPSEAFDYIDEILARQGKRLSARLDITMPWNHPLGQENLPSTATTERIAHLQAEMQRKLDVFAELVLARKAYFPEDTEADYEIPRWQKVLFSWIPKSLNYGLHRYMYQDLIRFYSDSTCNGCGICEHVCLGQKIALIDGKPVWQQAAKCYGCFACINYCPQQAIQVQSRFPVQSSTEATARYHHPAVTYGDIAGKR
ncbi:MAG: EFR1 family ferrodoxin [Anaerolineae bacterium]|jgi:NAD-dependent dihydropyrimidine dehydrogenase PreA subunit